ncbi:hypothetical protein ACFLY6_03250, partial [Candidatus Dependentiae bacterium]
AVECGIMPILVILSSRAEYAPHSRKTLFTDVTKMLSVMDEFKDASGRYPFRYVIAEIAQTLKNAGVIELNGKKNDFLADQLMVLGTRLEKTKVYIDRKDAQNLLAQVANSNFSTEIKVHLSSLIEFRSQGLSLNSFESEISRLDIEIYPCKNELLEALRSLDWSNVSGCKLPSRDEIKRSFEAISKYFYGPRWKRFLKFFVNSKSGRLITAFGVVALWYYFEGIFYPSEEIKDDKGNVSGIKHNAPLHRLFGAFPQGYKNCIDYIGKSLGRQRKETDEVLKERIDHAFDRFRGELKEIRETIREAREFTGETIQDINRSIFVNLTAFTRVINGFHGDISWGLRGAHFRTSSPDFGEELRKFLEEMHRAGAGAGARECRRIALSAYGEDRFPDQDDLTREEEVKRGEEEVRTESLGLSEEARPSLWRRVFFPASWFQ